MARSGAALPGGVARIERRPLVDKFTSWHIQREVGLLAED